MKRKTYEADARCAKMVSTNNESAISQMIKKIELSNSESYPHSSENKTSANEWNDLTEYFGLYRQMQANENNSPDSLQQIALTELAAHNSTTSAYARNMLVNEDKLVYNEPYIFPDDNLKSGKVIRRKLISDKNDVELKVYPNPARDYVIAEYLLGESKNNPTLNIIDVLGRTHQSITISSYKGYEVIPLKDLPSGIYTITLSSNGTTIKKAKVIVNK